jgi:hypothetical protein
MVKTETIRTLKKCRGRLCWALSDTVVLDAKLASVYGMRIASVIYGTDKAINLI